MSKVSKKGRNPGAVDQWLDNLGLYRKNVAYDETCLFRAISEQLFDCQVYHERVRKECLIFARRNCNEFISDFETTDKFMEHLDKLERHMIVCGDTELKIISKKYNRNITIFDATDQKICHMGDEELPEVFLLCLLDRDHYDVVYKKEHIVTAGFCQSVVYKILYENVFQVTNVDEIVHNMLYDKANIITQAELMMERRKTGKESDTEEFGNEEFEQSVDNRSLLVNIAPFPFKIAKALDPSIYRNIEYDSWGEMRREWRLGEWYNGDSKLILGTKCIFYDENSNERYDCYIQEMIKNENKCVVYLTKLAEKRTVNYSNLSPEDDAKPWPLPYRFSKSVVISPTTPPLDKNTSKQKKRRDKKSKSESSVLSSSNVAKHDALVDNVEAYVGIPLMQNMNNNENTTFCQTEMSIESPTESINAQEALPSVNVENETINNQRWYQNGYQWQPYVTPTLDPFVCPTSTAPNQNVFNFNMKPMVASAPVTPNVIPYHDYSYPFYCNYYIEPQPNYAQWSSPPPFELQSPPASRNHQKLPDQVGNEANVMQQVAAQHQIKVETNNNNCDQRNMSDVMAVSYAPQTETPVVYTPHCTPVELYPAMSPVVQVPQVPPGTSILYSTGHQEMTEVIVPTTPVMYSPPVEVPYAQPMPFIYPPTPPPTWYPTGITAQGFIFPQRP